MEEITGIKGLAIRFLNAVANLISKALPITDNCDVTVKVKTKEGWQVVDTGVPTITFTELDERFGPGNWKLVSK